MCMVDNSFTIEGTVRYYHNWCMAWLDDEIARYYRSLLPKALGVCPPIRPAHVSIVRLFEEVPNREDWGAYDGSAIRVTYYPSVQTDGIYYWLDVYSNEIGFIRRSLGLSTFRNTNPNYPMYSCYHLTIGNTKNKRKGVVM